VRRVDRQLCGTSAHVVVQNGAEAAGVCPVGWVGVVRESAMGAVLAAGLAAVLYFSAGPGPAVGVGGLVGAGTLLCWAGFRAFGHRVGCAAKKALVTVFGWWEGIS